MKITQRNARHVVAAVAFALAAPMAHAASVDYFLKIDAIPGESTDDRHKDEIQVLSLSLGAARDATTKKGAACLSPLNFIKAYDKASPLLFANAVSGMTIATATLTARKAGREQAEFLVITLRDVQVSAVLDSASSEAPIESVSLTFGTLTMQYKAQKPDGSLGDAIQTTAKGC
jgi:type VI secretion system secreted protein Hcp